MAISSAGVAGLKPGVVDNTAARPSTPFEGQMIFQKDTDQLLIWNGTAWVIPNQTTQNPEGLEFIKSQTIGSGVTSVEVTGAFSSTYDNYKILLNSTASVNTMISIRLGSSTTGYSGFLVYGDASSNTVLGVGFANQSEFKYIGGGTGASLPMTASVELLNPFATSYTGFVTGVYRDTSSYGTCQGEHKVSTSYTAFTLIAQTGTMTGGTVTVYGYRKG